MAAFLVFVTGASAFVYWANTGPSGGRTLGKANLDGSSVTPSFIRGGNVPCGVAVRGNFIYWGNHRGDSIGRALRTTGRQRNQHFIDGASGPCGIAVTGSHIYWANRLGRSIGRANLDGSGVNQSFITGANFPCGVAVDGSHIYWANEALHTIARANLDGTGVNQSFITGANGPCGVAVNGSNIFWANEFANTIGRANLDGTGVNQGFITGADHPCGIAVNSSHIYWANKARNTIAVARLNGTGVSQNLIRIRGSIDPCGVALDSGRSPTPPFSLRRTILHRRVGTATQEVAIPAPGRLVLFGSGLRKFKRNLDRGGNWKLPVRPRGGTRARLAARGQVNTTVRVKYIPVVGRARTKSKQVTLQQR